MKRNLIVYLLIVLVFSLISCKKLDLPWMQPGGGMDARPASIVCTGNHITFGPALDSADHYPSQLSRLLKQQGFEGVTVTEKGDLPRARIQAMTHQITETVDPYKTSNGRNIVVVTEFTDDAWDNHQTVESSIRLMADYCDSLRAHGWKVYTSTTPYQNPFYKNYSEPYPGADALVTPSAYDSAEYITQLSSINDSLRAHWSEFSDGIIDLGADARFKQFDPSFYQANHMDLTKKGAAAVAELVGAGVTTELKK